MDVFRQEYRELSEGEKALVDEIKSKAADLYAAFERMFDGPPFPVSARSKALAKTKLEEAVMWAVKGVTGPHTYVGQNGCSVVGCELEGGHDHGLL